MTTSDLIAEFFRERAPAIIRDIVREEMRDLLKKIENVPAVWECTWCNYRNIRFNAGLDHCSVCGSEAMTFLVAPGDLRVRYSKNPKTRQTANRRRGTRGGTRPPGALATSTTSYQPPS